MKTIVTFVSAIIFVCILSTYTAIGATIHVPGDQPTIQDGIDAASDGDTILVAEGTYYETVCIQNLNNITLSGAGINRSIIDGGGVDRVINAQRNHDLTIVIEGFTIRNGTGWGAGIILNTDGPCCNSSVNAIIRNCEVTDNDGTGIEIVNDWTGTSHIKNNIICNNSGNGFDPYLGTYYVQHNTIVNNQDGYHDWSGSSANVIIRDNIIALNRGYGIFKHSTTPVSISYNDVWNNGEGAYYEGYSGPATPFTPSPGTGEISEDPLFLGEGDYHLTFASPCIDAGTDVGVYIDMDGEVRPVGHGFDMGADEYLPSACTLDLNLSYTGETLTMDFDLGTPEPANWNVWLSFQTTMLPLWSVSLPVIDPPTPFSIPISGFPHLGIIGFLTTLTTPEGIICSDWETVDTGSLTHGGAVPTVENLQELFRGKGKRGKTWGRP